MNSARMVSRYARFYKSKTAIICGDRRWSFLQVNERANRLANCLLELDIRPGDRVASLMRNCTEHIEIMFARYKTGAVEVSLNTRLSPEELAFQLNDSQAPILIAAQDQLQKIDSVRGDLKYLRHLIALSGASGDLLDYESIISDSDALEPKVESDPKELGKIMYTGGTTGRPRGVMLRRSHDVAVTRNLLLDIFPDLGPDDVFIGLQPLHHAVGYFVLPCWVRGTPQVIVPDFKAETALPVLEREKVTVVKTVPTVLIRILAHPDLGKYDLSRLRTIIYGASPMPVEKLKEAIERFGPILVQNYGQSEAIMNISYLSKRDHLDEGRLASVGRPYTLVETRVVDEQGRNVPPGELGEIIVQGDHIMMGYWNDPESTAEALRKGWIHTRDIARVDDEGYIFLVDRKSEMIISGGLNIYPLEVEQILHQHPAVLEAVVFGVPDEKWGETVRAAVVLKPGMAATAQELIDFCSQRMARYKKPQAIDFVGELPKSDTGKILRRQVREPFWRGHERSIH